MGSDPNADRTYRCNPEHKGRNPFKTPCPKNFTQQEMEAILRRAIPDGPGHKKLYALFEKPGAFGIARFALEQGNTYHGYPLARPREVPAWVADEFIKRGWTTLIELRRLLRRL